MEEIIHPEDTLYFPPISGNEWETTSISSLGWSEANLNDLYNYLEQKNTKGFIILKDGKIVVERYFNGHNQGANWAWFSTVKSLTSTAIGVAQDEGLVDIDNKTSDYLGNNWSSLTQEQQDLITVKHHLTMTTGLQNTPNNFIEWTCTIPLCMQYNAEAGTKWQYHQGAFTQVQNILTQATDINFKIYIKTKILDKIGASGSWDDLLGANIFSSNTRNMARFGLLTLNKGTWDDNTLLSESYFNDMINTSQNINQSYGYLWWLNGKNSFMGTATQDIFTGSIIPNAPNNMFAALGAQDQKIYVVPNQNLVIIRTGESAGTEQLANSSFDNELWEKINLVINYN
ncbi:serine hydrolase domain-containing protein [Psychroserpens sp.]